MNMPPLPEPVSLAVITKAHERREIFAYSADQLRAYGQACWNAAIEAAAARCDEIDCESGGGFDAFASAIRSMKEPE